MSRRSRGVNVAVLAVCAYGLAGHLGSTTAVGGPKSKTKAIKKSAGESPAPVVCLKTRQQDLSKGHLCGLLYREVFRQALLIAARDEMGLRTRDMTLREPFPDKLDPGDGRMDIEVTGHVDVGVRVKVWNAQNGNNEVFEKTWPLSDPECKCITYPDIVPKAESLSRNEFVDVLKKSGVKGRAIKPAGTAKPTKTALELLASMDDLSQFAALRSIHASIRKNGESPALLGALVRGYAHLGVLTEFHWLADQKAFKARAMLYAERLMQRYPSSSWALWHRAYARALTGLHSDSLADLEAAKTLRESKGEAKDAYFAEKKAPAWVALINAYCRFGIEELRRAGAKEGSTQELAMLLRIVAIAHCDSALKIMKAAEELTELNPGCHAAFAITGAAGGIGNMNRATTESPMNIGIYLPLQLGALSGVPKRVAKFGANVEDEAGMERFLEALAEGRDSEDAWIVELQAKSTACAQAMVQATQRDEESGEPSWAMMGRMLEETLFAQIMARADFMRVQWGVEVDEYVQAAMPLLAKHPLGRCLGCYTLNPERDREELADLVGQVTFDDIQDGGRRLLFYLNRASREGQRFCPALSDRLRVYSDMIAGDLRAHVRGHRGQSGAWYAEKLRHISPHCPDFYAWQIRNDWEAAMPRARQLEDEYGAHVQVLAALAAHYIQAKKNKNAERCLRKLIDVSPDGDAYSALAKLYKQEGRIAEWLQTLEDYLKQDDPGLEHAHTRCKIAEHYMSEGDFKKALPYAEAAVESWSSYSMVVAIQCYEGARDWKKAELWSQRMSDRYNTEWASWYFWCKRTNRGDLESAKEFVETRISQLKSTSASSDDLCRMGVYCLLEDRSEAARKYFDQAFEKSGNPFDGLHAAIMADLNGDEQRRDAILKSIQAHGLKFGQGAKRQLVELAELLIEALAKNKGQLDLEIIDQFVDDGNYLEGINILYFVGRFLEKRGEKDDSEKYLRRSAANRGRQKINQVLAIDLLRKRGVKIDPVVPGSTRMYD